MPIGGSGISSALPDLRARFEEHGRDPADLHIVAFGSLPTSGKLEHLALAGCTEVVLRVPSGDTSDMLRRLDTFVPFLEQGWSAGG
jgi:hypothetical protein